MKFGVVVFPGSNCDEDIFYVLSHVLQQETVKIWHKDTSLQGCDAIILPGGFSYGDYLRSGAIARFSPVMNEVIRHAQNGGFVMGICNGFQILTESGLLEGALLHNLSQRFICKNTYLMPASQKHGLDTLERRCYKIPIAHAEGRYYASDDTIKSLQDNDQIIFKYCNEAGVVDEASNPNGSLLNIAGISNKEGNVIGMMPHPERAAEDMLGNSDGKLIFEAVFQLVS